VGHAASAEFKLASSVELTTSYRLLMFIEREQSLEIPYAY
jgi:hypothetical protein